MINIQEILKAIRELEEEDTTFSNCERLAALYTVVDHNTTSGASPIIQEYSEILPSYQLYCKVKRKYEMKELNEEAVKVALKTLCAEIKDFLVLLYANTETQMERNELRSMLNSLNFFDK